MYLFVALMIKLSML